MLGQFGRTGRVRVGRGVGMLFCAIHEFIKGVEPVVTEATPEALPVVDPLVEELSIGWICLSHTIQLQYRTMVQIKKSRLWSESECSLERV